MLGGGGHADFAFLTMSSICALSLRLIQIGYLVRDVIRTRSVSIPSPASLSAADNVEESRALFINYIVVKEKR